MDAKVFGSFIAEQRKAKNMTQKDLAERIHVTDKAISRWETGHGFPDIGTLGDLAKELDVSIVELMQSRKSESGDISLKDAEESINSTLEMNMKERHKERRLLLCILIPSVLVFVLISVLRLIPIVAGIGIVYAIVCTAAMILLLSDALKNKNKTGIFCGIILAVIPVTIVFILLSCSFAEGLI